MVAGPRNHLFRTAGHLIEGGLFCFGWAGILAQRDYGDDLAEQPYLEALVAGAHDHLLDRRLQDCLPLVTDCIFSDDIVRRAGAGKDRPDRSQRRIVFFREQTAKEPVFPTNDHGKSRHRDRRTL